MRTKETKHLVFLVSLLSRGRVSERRPDSGKTRPIYARNGRLRRGACAVAGANCGLFVARRSAAVRTAPFRVPEPGPVSGAFRPTVSEKCPADFGGSKSGRRMLKSVRWMQERVYPCEECGMRTERWRAYRQQGRLRAGCSRNGCEARFCVRPTGPLSRTAPDNIRGAAPPLGAACGNGGATVYSTPRRSGRMLRPGRASDGPWCRAAACRRGLRPWVPIGTVRNVRRARVP